MKRQAAGKPNSDRDRDEFGTKLTHAKECAKKSLECLVRIKKNGNKRKK